MNAGCKMGLRVLMYYGLMMLLSILFLVGMNGWLLYTLNALLLLGFGALVFNDCAYQGEKAATTLAMVEKQRAEGHTVDPLYEKQVFSKRNAVYLLLTAALPLLLLSAVNLALEPHYPVVEVTTAAEEPAAEEETEKLPYDEGAFPEANAELPQPAEPISRAALFMAFMRALFMPFLGLYTLVSAHVLYVLFLPLSLLLPTVGAIGYLQGPKLREKKLDDIEKGKKRKMRNLRVNKKPRKPRSARPEV
ncbi:MAG: hypothetical protein ACOYI8_05965 [Christensenellales bacterium]|jgi:hypothetical protein